MTFGRSHVHSFVDLPRRDQVAVVAGGVTGHPYSRTRRLVVRGRLDHPDAAKTPSVQPDAELLEHLARECGPVVLAGLAQTTQQEKPDPSACPYGQEPPS